MLAGVGAAADPARMLPLQYPAEDNDVERRVRQRRALVVEARVPPRRALRRPARRPRRRAGAVSSSCTSSPARVRDPARPLARGVGGADGALTRREVAVDECVVVRRLADVAGRRRRLRHVGPALDVRVVGEDRLGESVWERGVASVVSTWSPPRTLTTTRPLSEFATIRSPRQLPAYISARGSSGEVVEREAVLDGAVGDADPLEHPRPDRGEHLAAVGRDGDRVRVRRDAGAMRPAP